MEPNPETVILSSDDEEDQNQTFNDKQIVLYDPTSIGSRSGSGSYMSIVPIVISNPTPIQCRPPPAPFTSHYKVLPSVGDFTVQCARCYKWRLIPSKEKYEEIRESILVKPFVCEVAKEWRPEICCEVVSDVEPDGSRLWAMDKPNIAQTPPGWEREVRIRGQGSTKFADVYYTSPYGKRLRSMVEIQKYLLEHPEFAAQGVTLSQFSFQTPKPSQENYVRKRPCTETNWGTSRPFESQVSPISWAPPNVPQPVEPVFSHSYPLGDSSLNNPPMKKKARTPSEFEYFSDINRSSMNRVKTEGPSTPSGVYDPPVLR